MITPEQWKQTDTNAFAQFFSIPSSCEKSLDYAVEYCNRYESLLKNIWESVHPPTKGVVLCVFGSPARYEMLGESDLDCMLIREDGLDVDSYRSEFISKANSYGFSKIDIPVWGSLSDCKNYMKYAITEGNQVVESRLLMGDTNTWSKVNTLRDEYCTRDRFRITFAFQYFYFDQYYKQRERNNQHNLKYGHGGTRDFLFPVWLANLREGYDYVSHSKTPAITRGLQSLLERGNISIIQFEEMKKAANVIALLRNELLRQSIGTEDSGLTFLGEKTAQRLVEIQPKIFSKKEYVLCAGVSGLNTIASLKKICYEAFMNEEDVKNRIGPGIKLDPSEELSATVLSWKSNLEDLESTVLKTLGSSSSWAVLTSLACNPTCPEKLLQILAEKGTDHGYEYVAKVVGRNPRTTQKTLTYIINSNIEDRFKEPAKVRLEKGWKKANELQ